MNDQCYYAVLSDTLIDDFNQPKVLEYLGCYDFYFDALDRFLIFYNSDDCTLYTYENINPEGRLLGLSKVESELPAFSDIMRTITV